MKPVRFVLATALACSWSTGIARAQADTARLSGTVMNAAGEAVPDAVITLKKMPAGSVTELRSGPAGMFEVLNLAAGDYEISAAAGAATSGTTAVTLAAGGDEQLNLTLAPAVDGGAGPSLADLGFDTEQIRGDPKRQALLDKRSRMLQMHQRLGLITAGSLVATLIAAGGAEAEHGATRGSTGRNVHAALGIATTGLYITTALYAVRAPKVDSGPTRGSVRLHKALAWVHAAGMIATPILGAMAYRQIDRGERVHGIAKAHSAVAMTTVVAYSAAVAAVTLKF